MMQSILSVLLQHIIWQQNINKLLESERTAENPDKERIERYENYLNSAENIIERIQNIFPHGSGINYDYAFDTSKWTNKKISFSCGWQLMNEDGYYTRTIWYTVTVIPVFWRKFKLNIVGNFGKDQDIKEYLYEVYQNFFGDTLYDFIEDEFYQYDKPIKG